MFSIPVFFVVFRETIEAAVIVSVLLAFLSRVLRHKHPRLHRIMTLQVWAGTAVGLAVSLAVGVTFVMLWDQLSTLWEANETLYEGIFCLIACVFVTMMALAMLRTGRMQERLEKKLQSATLAAQSADGYVFNSHTKKFAFFLIPLVTILREGIETTLFLSGVSLNEPASSIPLAAATGILAGCIIGVAINKAGNTVNLQTFFTIMTSLLFVIGSGLVARGIISLEEADWASKTGAADPDDAVGLTVDLRSSVWYLRCCDPRSEYFWSIANALVGWNNTATVSSVIGYCAYWAAVVCGIVFMRLRDNRRPAKEPTFSPVALDCRRETQEVEEVKIADP